MKRSIRSRSAAANRADGAVECRRAAWSACRSIVLVAGMAASAVQAQTLPLPQPVEVPQLAQASAGAAPGAAPGGITVASAASAGAASSSTPNSSIQVPGMAAAMRFWGNIRPSLPGQDPFERVNRAVFIFNGVVDHFVVKPVAEAYEAAVPKPIRTGVGNVLGNVSDAWSAVNLVLQGKGTRAAEMTMRVGLNTVFGLGGLLDIATEAGLERQSEDFGQTLGRWGLPPGPYLVLPFFGPSSVRDAVGFGLDTAYNSAVYPSDAPQKWRWTGVRLTDARTDALPFTRLLDTVALDKYTFVRDAYLTRRRSLVYDGNPPPDDQDELPVEAPVQE